jgi:molecular chaperone DnaJ
MAERDDPPGIFGQFEQLFGEFFGGQQADRRGADRRQPLKLTYPEARDGCMRSVDVLREVVCAACAGTGARDGGVKICARCRGERTVGTTRGPLEVTHACPDCGGTGRYILDPCERCERGLRPSAEAMEVPVPAGIKTGDHLKLAGKGDELPGGATPGDLYFAIEVDLLDELVPYGDDVVIETTVQGRHVLLGGRLEVRGLDGSVTVQVPRGVRDGDRVRIEGLGNVRTSAAAGAGAPAGDPYREVARGDQIVVFRVPSEATRARNRAIAFLVTAVAVASGIFAIL